MIWIEREIPLSQLKNYEKNPRKMSKKDAKHIRESLEKYGQCQDIVVNADYQIIGGHQRARIFKEMGHKTCKVKISDRLLTGDEVEELNIRLNRNHGEWDYDILSNEFDLLKLVNWGFEEKDFQLPSELEEKEETKEYSVKISFSTIDDLRHAFPSIVTLAADYPGAKYKTNGVKCQ